MMYVGISAPNLSQSNGSIQGVRLGARVSPYNWLSDDMYQGAPGPGYLADGGIWARTAEALTFRPVQTLQNGVWTTISQIN